MEVREEYLWGIHPITETILAGRPINKIWVKSAVKSPSLLELIALARREGIPCSRVPLAKLDRLTKAKHQGVVALVSPITFGKLEGLLPSIYEKGRVPLLVLLDEVQDTHNLGAIARSALAAGADGLVVGRDRGAPLTSGTMKASAGALAHLPVCREASLGAALKCLHQHGVQVVACSEKATSSLYDIDLTGPTAFLLGGEGRGITLDHWKCADISARIPMAGAIASLNVSVAGALVLYEAARQRRKEAISRGL